MRGGCNDGIRYRYPALCAAPVAMVRDARRRAPHHEDLILRSPLSRQRTSAVRSGLSKDEAIEVEIALPRPKRRQRRLQPAADPYRRDSLCKAGRIVGLDRNA